MPRGKKPLDIPKRELRLFIPEYLYNEIQVLLLDPFTMKPKYGEISKVGERLFTHWVKEVQSKGTLNV